MAAVLCTFAVVAALWKFGVFNAVAKTFVDHSIDTMKKETERQQNQPKIVVLKTGERIDCKKVNDQGQHWGLVRKDGKFTAVRKDEVQEIIDDAPNPAAQ